MGRQDALVPHWDCIYDLVKDHGLMVVLGTSYEVLLFELPFLVDSEMGTVGTVGYNERDSPGMVGIVSWASASLICRTHRDTDLGACGPAAVTCTHDDCANLDVSDIPDRGP